jgi:hypothetical protein
MAQPAACPAQALWQPTRCATRGIRQRQPPAGDHDAGWWPGPWRQHPQPGPHPSQLHPAGGTCRGAEPRQVRCVPVLLALAVNAAASGSSMLLGLHRLQTAAWVHAYRPATCTKDERLNHVHYRRAAAGAMQAEFCWHSSCKCPLLLTCSLTVQHVCLPAVQRQQHGHHHEAGPRAGLPHQLPRHAAARAQPLPVHAPHHG